MNSYISQRFSTKATDTKYGLVRIGSEPGIGLNENRVAKWDNHEALRVAHDEHVQEFDAHILAFDAHSHAISAVNGLEDMLTAFHQRMPIAQGYRDGSDTAQVSHWYKTDPFLSHNNRILIVKRGSAGVYQFILKNVNSQLQTSSGDITELEFFFGPTDNNLASIKEPATTDTWRLQFNANEDVNFAYMVMMR
jgi:hypothetical protein